MNTIHFGIMLIFNLCIGTITPPVGTTLFVGVKVGGVKIETVFKQLITYFAAIFCCADAGHLCAADQPGSAQSDGLCEIKCGNTPICSAPSAGTPAAGFFCTFLLERVDSRGAGLL